MKYWNKQKRVRLIHWQCVELTRSKMKSVGVDGGIAYIPFYEPTYDLLKRWCQNQPSTGKFYSYQASDRWWFEFESDALLFMLKWCR